MARLMNALQLALGSVGSGIQGYGQARAAREEQEREQKRMAEAANRQSMLDQIALVEKGFVERGARQDRTKAAAPAIGAMVNTALSSVGVGGGPVGMLPDLSAVEKTAGMYGTTPAQSFTVGGKTYDQMQTTQEQNAMGRAQALQDAEAKKTAELAAIARDKAAQRQIKDQDERDLASAYVAAFTGRDGKPMPMAQALAAAKSGKTPLDLGFAQKPMTEEEQQRLAIMKGNLDVSRGQLGVSKDRLAFDKTKESQPKIEKDAKLTAAKKAANDVLPTVIAASNAVSKWGDNEIKSLNPFLIATQSAATLEGGTWGAVKSKALSKLGITNLDKEYLQYASAVADAVARASEVGVLTNQDINRFRSQVSFDGGENETQIRFKLNNLKSWASWLANSKKNIDAADGSATVPSSNYGSVAKIPGETDKEYESRTGKSATGANANPYR